MLFIVLIRTMIYAGSVLMVYNIYRYQQYARKLTDMGGWDEEQRTLRIPVLLLVMFLCGYLAVGILGQPDLVVAGILFGGSIFVFLMVLFIERVTERIQENEHLAADLRAAEESSRAKTNFLSTMSHEIRTPLNAIIGLNGLVLGDTTLSPTSRNRMEKQRVSAEHLLTLINDVLDMSRIESGRMELTSEPFDMHEVLEQINTIVDAQCADKGLRYTFNLAGDLDHRYVGDPIRLKQALINLLGNAVKFTDEGGEVRLAVRQLASEGNHRTLSFEVSDTGVGMDESFLPKLFTTFTQENDTSTNRYGGSGLGLAITKRIVDMMDGDISVQSEKGVGSTFTVVVTLDACEDGELGEFVALEDEATLATSTDDHDLAATIETTETGTATEAAMSLEGLHVLMAEDVDINAEILEDLLDMEGMTAARAENGQAAVNLFSQSAAGYFDIVLMDVRMPVMDGLTAAKTIRSLNHPDAATVPIIALTANAFDEDVQRSLQAGMNAHLSKPIDPDQLYDTIGRLTAGRR